MALFKWNGTEIQPGWNAQYNKNELSKIYYNGTEVWTKTVKAKFAQTVTLNWKAPQNKDDYSVGFTHGTIPITSSGISGDSGVISVDSNQIKCLTNLTAKFSITYTMSWHYWMTGNQGGSLWVFKNINWDKKEAERVGLNIGTGYNDKSSWGYAAGNYYIPGPQDDKPTPTTKTFPSSQIDVSFNKGDTIIFRGLCSNESTLKTAAITVDFTSV